MVTATANIAVIRQGLQRAQNLSFVQLCVGIDARLLNRLV